MDSNHTIVERKSDRDLIVTRRFNAPAGIIFQAWTRPELFKQWWAPKSMGVPLRSCEMDARPGGKYRVEFGHDTSSTFAFYGKYLEVAPGSRLAWTNEEDEDGAVTTVTLEERDGATQLVLHEAYPTKEALDRAIGGTEGAIGEQFAQLDELLTTMAAGAGR